ncbi:hypothetical protein PY092_13525 [Muricauda sp. 334s03]|uniref:Uncharacterized protein n=1 Tax=Flagellimonas yonaguniensis TaxID=3031325 RepID=A0ABT5Y287_9FLAO|nr:hypothetical protein [[Muricauda] yonaguniensis]MDF0717177.1 hypothetical protein [[Muricauda] yonaguniensis]
MNFLNEEIASRTKRKKLSSLLKRQISCGTFQDLEPLDLDHDKRLSPKTKL